MAAQNCVVQIVDSSLEKPFPACDYRVVEAFVLLSPFFVEFVKVKEDIRGGNSIDVFEDVGFYQKWSPNY